MARKKRPAKRAKKTAKKPAAKKGTRKKTARKKATRKKVPARKAARTKTTAVPDRRAVPKTYKLYVGGKFPRTESGRYYELIGKRGDLLANVSRASRTFWTSAWLCWASRPGSLGKE